MPVSGSRVPLTQLAGPLKGRVVSPGDDEYDSMRTLFSGSFDGRPAAIVRPADDEDVARVIAMARERGLTLAIRGGGHSIAGHSTTTGGIVLDMRDMTSLEIDPDGRTAWAGAGLSAGAYTTAVGSHGLATGFGDTASVGIAGITLGGGIGYLTRKHGLTIDSLVAADLVTASGDVVRADQSSHADLFWAIRGGGGNFGVATRLKFRLHPVDRVVGGMLILPATPDVVHGFVAAAQDAPEELSTIANVMPAPPMPFVPPEHHGKLVVLGLMCYAGDAEAGARVLAPFRSLATPLVDMLRPIAYPEMYPPEDHSLHPMVVGRTVFAPSIGRTEAGMIVEELRASDAPMRAVQIRALGGAMARVAPDATAFAHRAARTMVGVVAFYSRPDERPARYAWAARLADVLANGETGAYVNFVGEEEPERVRAAYPGSTWERLASIKARYDPTNLFRRNHNVPPARATSV